MATREQHRLYEKKYRESHRDSRRASQLQYYYANHTARRAKDNRDYIFREHGITIDQKQERIKAQDYKCALCGTTEPGGRHGSWHTDHNHTTDQLRDELCARCNLGLGMFDDSPELFMRAVAYLEKWQPNA